MNCDVCKQEFPKVHTESKPNENGGTFGMTNEMVMANISFDGSWQSAYPQLASEYRVCALCYLKAFGINPSL